MRISKHHRIIALSVVLSIAAMAVGCGDGKTNKRAGIRRNGKTSTDKTGLNGKGKAGSSPTTPPAASGQKASDGSDFATKKSQTLNSIKDQKKNLESVADVLVSDLEPGKYALETVTSHLMYLNGTDHFESTVVDPVELRMDGEQVLSSTINELRSQRLSVGGGAAGRPGIKTRQDPISRSSSISPPSRGFLSATASPTSF
ncbi:MAG: hypothetical protein HC902_11945 [Calothrix sp. SM1_5_4]|nr:hypothetical protein [Calothrix sp. SM1_5_4]